MWRVQDCCHETFRELRFEITRLKRVEVWREGRPRGNSRDHFERRLPAVESSDRPALVLLFEDLLQYSLWFMCPLVDESILCRGADKSLARPNWKKKNWKFAIFRPTRRSLLPRRSGWTDKLLNFFFFSGLQKFLVGLRTYLHPGTFSGSLGALRQKFSPNPQVHLTCAFISPQSVTRIGPLGTVIREPVYRLNSMTAIGYYVFVSYYVFGHCSFLLK